MAAQKNHYQLRFRRLVFVFPLLVNRTRPRSVRGNFKDPDYLANIVQKGDMCNWEGLMYVATDAIFQ